MQKTTFNPVSSACVQGSPLPPPSAPSHVPVATPSSTARAVEGVRQEALPPFKPFSIKISEIDCPISSWEEMRAKAQEIGKKIFEKHTQIRIDLSPPYARSQQEKQFLNALREVADVIETRWETILYVTPKKTEETYYGLTVRRYANGVVERVESASEDYAWEDWEGERQHPNGTIETGKFERFRLRRGISVENGVTMYHLPDKVLGGAYANRYLIYADIKGERRLIVVHEPTEDASAYTQIEEPMIEALAKILEKEGNVNARSLREILSGPVNCEEFIRFLFQTERIFSLKQYPLQILLEIIQEKKLAVNLHQRHRDTNETLLSCYSENTKILQLLLTMDPTLIQRIEGAESAFVSALLAGNKKGASAHLSAMEQQHIELLPRELIFRKVAFSEGVTKEELQALSHEDQEIAYRLANIYSQLPTVEIMNGLGFGRNGEALLMREGPSIFGCNMDALEMRTHLHGFLKNLRSQGLLLTTSEFRALSKDDYVEKGSDIGRILGRDYIEKRARELGLKHVKVPRKMMVIKDNTNLTLRTSPTLDLADPSHGVMVYAEKIQRANRQPTVEEVSELLRLFETTGYSDICWDLDDFNPGNIRIAEDGIYIIDTEFTNFWLARFYFERGRQYAEMVKVVHVLPHEQQGELIDELNGKITTYQQKEKELEGQLQARTETERNALQKTGCLSGPQFTFTLDELTDQHFRPPVRTAPLRSTFSSSSSSSSSSIAPSATPPTVHSSSPVTTTTHTPPATPIATPPVVQSTLQPSTPRIIPTVHSSSPVTTTTHTPPATPIATPPVVQSTPQPPTPTEIPTVHSSSPVHSPATPPPPARVSAPSGPPDEPWRRYAASAAPRSRWEEIKGSIYVFDNWECGWAIIKNIFKIAAWAISILSLGVIPAILWAGSHTLDHFCPRRWQVEPLLV